MEHTIKHNASEFTPIVTERNLIYEVPTEILAVLLRCVYWYLFTDISGQPIGTILDNLTLEDGPDTLSRNVGK